MKGYELLNGTNYVHTQISTELPQIEVKTTCDECEKAIDLLIEERDHYKNLYESITANYTHQCNNCKMSFHSKKDICFCQYCKERCVAL